MTDKTQDYDAFEDLVQKCIEAFKITLSDATALDANGVIGKERILILENHTYQRETRKIRAQSTINNLKEINDLLEEVNSIGGDEGEQEALEEEIQDGIDKMIEEHTPEVVDDTQDEEPEVDFTEPFDIRNPNKRPVGRPKKGDKGKEKKVVKVATGPKVTVSPKAEATRIIAHRSRMDKTKLEMKLKIIDARREVMAELHANEEVETESLNIFFIALTREEFEALETVEVFDGDGGNRAFNSEESVAVNLGKKHSAKQLARQLENPDKGFHTETIDDEEFVVED